jgi:hypothetical protein
MTQFTLTVYENSGVSCVLFLTLEQNRLASESIHALESTLQI